MASINNTPTTNAGTLALNDLVTELVLGAVSIERGLVNVIPNAQDLVEIPDFTVANDKLQAYQETQTTGNDSMTKGKVIIGNEKIQWYDTYNPILNFENDWSSFWHSGSMNEAQLNARIRTAVISETAKGVANNVEKCLWQGDTAGAAHLAFFDGYEKLLTASTAVNKVTDLAVPITAANIISVMQACIDATPAAVLELGSSKFVMSHRMKQLYYEATRDLGISKGINIFEDGTSRFAGFEIVSNGISDNKIMLANAVSGKDGVLKATTWMANDWSSAKIARTQEFSDLWGVLYTFRLGVGLILENQITYYDGTTV